MKTVQVLFALCDWLESGLIAATAATHRLLEALLAEAIAPEEERELEAG